MISRYTKDENKGLVIVFEEAEIVKRIRPEYLESASILKIARGLKANGIVPQYVETAYFYHQLRRTADQAAD